MKTEYQKYIRVAVAGYAGLELTDEQLRELGNDSKISASIAANGIDTTTRSLILNFLAQKLVGKAWPKYGAKESHADFFEEFDRQAETKGYVLI